MSNNNSSYGNIFKTTFLFGFVQVFNIAVKVVLNKIVAILLGAEGMGIIGIYNTAVQMIKTGAGLGINQSAVRDISEANACDDYNRFSRIISLTNNVIFLTALLGLIATIVLSPWLSELYFKEESHVIAFVWLSLVVALNILCEGQLAILKGMRRLKDLAKASMLGSVVGLFSAVPFYYFFNRGGIIPSLMVTACASVIFTYIFVRRIDYKKSYFTLREFLHESTSMIKMGVALMFVNFIASIFDMVVAGFISNTGSIADVGLYNAGAAIITSYFGIIITAMSTDYYPRISAINNDNARLADEMNKQSETGLILIFPLVVLFVFLSPVFINILYSSDFNETNNYTDIAIIGTIVVIVADCMGMILLAKQASRLFITLVLSQRIVMIGIYLLGYKYYGLLGLGVAYVINSIFHLILMVITMNYHYKIKISKKVVCLLLLVIITTVITVFARNISHSIIKYSSGCFLLLFSFFFTMIYMRKNMGIDILQVINKAKNKLR